MVKCPLCTNVITEPRYALSRRDNKTKICPECGELEALEDFLKAQNPRNVSENELADTYVNCCDCEDTFLASEGLYDSSDGEFTCVSCLD